MEFSITGTRRARKDIVTAARQSAHEMEERVVHAAQASAEAMLKIQTPEGFWCGDLTADTTLESDYILLQLWLHQPNEHGVWAPPSMERIEKACNSILKRQLADGGWCIYPGGPSEVNATARAYTALKLAGHNPDRPYMVKARDCVHALGGLQAGNSYTKINFSLFGLYPRKSTPSVPPEIVLAPGDIIYEMSSWTRAIIVPLSIVQALQKEKRTPLGMDVEELFHPHRKLSLPKRDAASLVFNQVDRAVKIWERRGLKNLRARAIREAERWMLERTRYSEGLGAIYPSMMYLIMALESLGYAEDHPDLVEAIRQFEKLILETDDSFQFQPCFSPVWDTAICAFALGEQGGPGNEEALTRAADWLIEKEVRRKGDWSIKRPNLEPSGWAFEFANEYYPDIDDTAMVLLAFRHSKASDPEKQRKAEQRAINWLIGMQGADGGWAAFDVDNNWALLTKVPFADHNAMLDPACPDITGRVLEALVKCGIPKDHPAIRRGVQYLLNTQERDGCWYGRWGVNYIYGTFLALRGLRHAALEEARPAMQKGAEWMRSVQNRDGGWGESCMSYETNHYVTAVSTPSQTAWALLGLNAAGDPSSPVVQRGLDYLTSTQRADGRWDEPLSTGTGFPNVFYLSYHLYRDYFPMLALATLSPK